MKMYKNSLATIVLLLTNLIAVAMDSPMAQSNKKRSLENAIENEAKLQKTEWLSVNNWLSSLPEAQRLIEIDQLLALTPRHNFWYSVNTVHRIIYPEVGKAIANKPAWDNMRLIVENQLKEASPAIRNQLAQLLLNRYEGSLGIASLIGFYTFLIVTNCKDAENANFYTPVLRILISNANPQQRFDALYYLLEQNMDAAKTYNALGLLFDFGIDPYTRDMQGRSILDYVQQGLVQNPERFRALEFKRFLDKFSIPVLDLSL